MTTRKLSVLLLGASSDIALALARAYARAGHSIILAARDVGRLELDAADLKNRYGGEARLAEFNALEAGSFSHFLESLGLTPDIAICAVGLLGDQAAAAADSAAADLIMRTNFNGPALILNEIATRMERRGSGTIVGISSVAGDRGRASNYIYGSAKAGFTAFLSGLRNRLAKTGVHVVTVKPGFVNTRMTANMRLPKALTAQPTEVAERVLKATTAGDDVVYVYPIWRLIMIAIGLLPERLFKRTKL